MERKILIAVDGSPASFNCIDYVANISSVVTNLTYSLYYVHPTISSFIQEEAIKDQKARKEFLKIKKKNEQFAEDILAKAKEKMLKLGILEKHIEVLHDEKKMGIAKDIILRGENGLYDAIVMGRRGLTRSQEFFLGSTTKELVDHAKKIPIWIIDGKIKSLKILFASDGSAPSMRAVDHLAFMVGGNENVEIVVYHVMASLQKYCEISFDTPSPDIESVITQNEKGCIDDFYHHAFRLFKEAGIKENQISLKTEKRSLSIAKGILDELKKGSYGTIVIGRRGIHASSFMGGSAQKVIQKAENCGLWIVP